MKLLKFYASWCVPCKRLTSFLETQDLALEIEEINVEEEASMASQYDVMSVPVLVLLDDEGNEVARHSHSEPAGVQKFLEDNKCLNS